ncbi:MAG: hypothetical protein H7321_03805 [Bacteroidia bacterium]|nr:hypothetical protein [Bacteroidia bacterium]
MVRKISIRILIILAILFVSSIAYKKLFMLNDLKEHGSLLYSLLETQNKSDILYFGESSNFWISEGDTDRRTISEMIQSGLPGHTVGTLNQSAFHAGMYLPVIQQISEDSKVKTIIVTLNMRTLDQACINFRNETALQQEKAFYMPRPPMINRLMVSLHGYENVTEEVRDKRMWYAWEHDTLRFPYEFEFKTLKDWCFAPKHIKADGTEDFPKRELADHYIKAYAFQINTATNPRIKDLDNIVKTAKEKKLKLVFNILSENMHYADSLVGKDLVFLMRQNRDLLVERYTKMGAIVVDNLETVPGYDFAEKNWTTEHYGQLGRRLIAEKVIEVLK